MVNLTKDFLNSLLSFEGDKIFTDQTGLLVRAKAQKSKAKSSVMFFLRYRKKGKDLRVTIGKWPFMSISEARKEYYRIIDCIERGESWEVQEVDESDVTVQQAWTEWRQHKDIGLSANTIKKYGTMYNRYLAPFAKYSITKLDAKFIKFHIIDPMIDAGTFDFAHYVASTLKSFLDYCLFLGYIERNSLVGINNLLPKIKRSHFATFNEETMRQDMIDLFAAFKNESKQLRTLLYMHFYTLLRNTELREMRWANVDGSFAFCTVQTKCHPDFKVPLCTQAQRIVRELYRRRKPYSEFVCGNEHGEPFSNMTLNRSLKRKGINFVVHGVRACGRQFMQQEPGIKESIAELCLAHAPGDQVIQAYNRGQYFQARADAMQKWGDFVDSCIKSAGAEIDFGE